MQLYYETRNLPTNPPATLAADIARYIQMRQYVLPAVVVCENPTAIMSAARKQWFKATRYLQRLRASTLNAEEILRLTHVLMHMQNMQFTARTPLEQPNMAAYFLSPDQLHVAPKGTQTLYIACPLPTQTHDALFKHVRRGALVINYDASLNLAALGLEPKSALEQRLLATWDNLVGFLQSQGIEPANLVAGNTLQFTAMDEALDILLNASDEFLQMAAHFQREINSSQPFTTITSEQQKKFEAVTRLAHRVQALTPGNFNDYLSITFGDVGTGSGTFFLRDVGSELYLDLEAAAAFIAGIESEVGRA
jgi:hypothetical protein